MALSNQSLFDQLIVLAESVGISVRQDAMEGSRGGLYILKGKRHLVINRDLPIDEKADLLIENLRKENLDGVFVLPAVRERLDGG